LNRTTNDEECSEELKWAGSCLPTTLSVVGWWGGGISSELLVFLPDAEIIFLETFPETFNFCYFFGEQQRLSIDNISLKLVSAVRSCLFLPLAKLLKVCVTYSSPKNWNVKLISLLTKL